MYFPLKTLLFIVFLVGRPLCFYGAAHAHQLVGKKHCNAFCSCPHDQLVRDATDTKMAAGWEYDEY
jgi:hypothetical protein